MRVSKRQLKRIIREEKNKLIAETRLRRTIRLVIKEARRKKPKYRSSMERIKAEWDGPGESVTVAELEAIAKGMTPTEQSEYFKDFILTLLPERGNAPAGKISPDVLKWLVTNVQSANVNNYIRSYIGYVGGGQDGDQKVLEPKYQEIHDLMMQMHDKFKKDEVTAKDPSTPLNVLQQLASNKGHQYRDVRTAVAEHPNVSPELLEELSGDSEKGPVFAVAENPKTPVETLKKLASHENAGVRREVASNQSTPIDILMQLVTDPDRKDSAEGFGSVRKRVAANPNTPPGGLQKLATDQNKYVRIEVAKNPSTSPETLEQLLDDSVATVRRKAKKNPNLR